MATIKITPSQTIEAPTMVLNPSNYYSKIVITNEIIFKIVPLTVNFLVIENFTIEYVNYVSKYPNEEFNPFNYALNPLKMENKEKYIDIKYNVTGFDIDNNPVLEEDYLFNLSNKTFLLDFTPFIYDGNTHKWTIKIDKSKIDFGDSGLSANNIESAVIIFELTAGDDTRTDGGYCDFYKLQAVPIIKFDKTFDFNVFTNLSMSIKLDCKYYNYAFNLGRYYYQWYDDKKAMVHYQFDNPFVEYKNNSFVEYCKKVINEYDSNFDNKKIRVKSINDVGTETRVVFDTTNIMAGFAYYKTVKKPDYEPKHYDWCCLIDKFNVSIDLSKTDTEPLDDNSYYGEEETKNNIYELESPLFANVETKTGSESIYDSIANTILTRYGNKGKVVGQMAIKYTSYNDINGNLVYNGNDGKYINVGDIIAPYVLDEDELPIPFRTYSNGEPMEFIVMSSELNYENGRTYVLLEFQEK